MSLVDLVSKYMDQILGDIGKGMKSLLMDSQTMSVISVACPQSQLMSRDVYLFEKVTERRRSQHVLHFVTCICIMTPTNDNVAMLKQELKNPRFGSYHVFFTRHVVRALLKELAEHDPQEVVKSIGEIPLSFCALDAHVFSLPSPFAVEVEGLVSLCRALNFNPMICYMRNSPTSRDYAEALDDHLRKDPIEYSRNERPAMVLLFDRRLDPITPMLTQWTYQAMIHEIFGVRGNLVDLSAFDVPKDLQKIMLSSQADDFFCANMYKDFGEIGEIIRKLVADFQSRMKSHQQNIENIADIKDFISSYPEFKKMSGTVSRHVNLVGEISKFVTSNELLKVSEYEQNLCSGNFSSSHDGNLKDLLSSANVRDLDKKKLLCLYYIKKNYNFPSVAQHINLVSKETGAEKSHLDKLLRGLKSYSLMSSSNLSTNPAVIDTKKFFKGLRGIENVYTQHQPEIQRVLEELLKKKVSADVIYPSNFSPTNNILVYVIDGFTYEECKVARNLNVELNGNIKMGGSVPWRSESFLSHISN